jgi:hypothetical protein
MRKRIVVSNPNLKVEDRPLSERWIDLAQVATVEVTSEDPSFPIESVFESGGAAGWRASQKGPQQLRLIFDQPLSLRRIQLRFLEPERERTQEFVIRWSSANGGHSKEIVRQQWNFSPAGSTSELEEYDVNLEDVASLELMIVPDVTHNDALATLSAWRVG